MRKGSRERKGGRAEEDGDKAIQYTLSSISGKCPVPDSSPSVPHTLAPTLSCAALDAPANQDKCVTYIIFTILRIRGPASVQLRGAFVRALVHVSVQFSGKIVSSCVHHVSSKLYQYLQSGQFQVS